MNRGIDHLVMCVNDLEHARSFYSDLGFQLTPTALHPFGTANSLVQLEGSFLELLALADASSIAEPAPGRFSFAYHNRKFLELREGGSMLVFESRDALADQAEFRVKRLDTYEPFDFTRTATLPGGEEVTVGFSLAFVTHPEMPNAAFFTCQQHAPQHFWKPEYQLHRNTARAVRAVVMVAENPSRYADFFRALQGSSAVRETKQGLVVATARGAFVIMSRPAYENRYGIDNAPDEEAGPQFAAVVIEVSDLDALRAVVKSSGVDAEYTGNTVRIAAFGVVVKFDEKRQ